MRHHLAVQCVNIALIWIQRQLWKIQVKTTLTPEFNEKFACITTLNHKTKARGLYGKFCHL